MANTAHLQNPLKVRRQLGPAREQALHALAAERAQLAGRARDDGRGAPLAQQRRVLACNHAWGGGR